MHTCFWWVNLKESGHMENQRTDGRLITLALTQAGRAFSGLLWLSIGQNMGSCERGNELHIFHSMHYDSFVTM
jgi:hypothetical protein